MAADRRESRSRLRGGGSYRTPEPRSTTTGFPVETQRGRTRRGADVPRGSKETLRRAEDEVECRAIQTRGVHDLRADPSTDAGRPAHRSRSDGKRDGCL